MKRQNAFSVLVVISTLFVASSSGATVKVVTTIQDYAANGRNSISIQALELSHIFPTDESNVGHPLRH